ADILDRQRAARERARHRDAHARHGVQARAEGDARGRPREPARARGTVHARPGRFAPRGVPRRRHRRHALREHVARGGAHGARARPVVVLFEPPSRGRGVPRRAGVAAEAQSPDPFRRDHGRDGQVEPQLERRARISRPRDARAPPAEPGRERVLPRRPARAGRSDAEDADRRGRRRGRDPHRRVHRLLVVPLVPARLAFDPGGVPYSEAYGDVYHSADGGPAQARAVFLAGNALPGRWRGRTSFTVVETGFGLGLNFLVTCAAFLEDTGAPARLHYVSVEKHPFSKVDPPKARGRPPDPPPLASELVEAWPLPLPGFHRLHLARGRVALTLIFGDAREALPQLAARADAFYLDGFAPEKNPELWSPAIARELARLAAPGATLATWTVAGSVRAALAQAGFAVEKRPGFGHKREMLAGSYRGRAESSAGPDRRVAIVGAGIAGTSCAERLASRGWEVALIERHARVAREASGNPVGLLRPALHLEDT